MVRSDGLEFATLGATVMLSAFWLFGINELRSRHSVGLRLFGLF